MAIALERRFGWCVGSDAPGQVSVFNCFSEAMASVSVNGAVAGTIAAWNTGPGVLYAPGALAVPRAINPAEGRFSGGANHVILDWIGEIFHLDVTIDPDRLPPGENLALYVLRTHFALLDAFGVPVSIGPVVRKPAVKQDVRRQTS